MKKVLLLITFASALAMTDQNIAVHSSILEDGGRLGLKSTASNDHRLGQFVFKNEIGVELGIMMSDISGMYVETSNLIHRAEYKYGSVVKLSVGKNSTGEEIIGSSFGFAYHRQFDIESNIWVDFTAGIRVDNSLDKDTFESAEASIGVTKYFYSYND